MKQTIYWLILLYSTIKRRYLFGYQLLLNNEVVLIFQNLTPRSIKHKFNEKD